jgi:hypothetical protein
MTKLQMMLMDIITLDGAEWSDIANALRNQKFKSWHKVRAEIDELIESGLINKITQNKTEIYVRAK